MGPGQHATGHIEPSIGQRCIPEHPPGFRSAQLRCCQGDVAGGVWNEQLGTIHDNDWKHEARGAWAPVGRARVQGARTSAQVAEATKPTAVGVLEAAHTSLASARGERRDVMARKVDWISVFSCFLGWDDSRCSWQVGFSRVSKTRVGITWAHMNGKHSGDDSGFYDGIA